METNTPESSVTTPLRYRRRGEERRPRLVLRHRGCKKSYDRAREATMRHRPKRPPHKPHKPAPLPRVRRLSKGMHFGLACIGVLFAGLIAVWIWGSGAR